MHKLVPTFSIIFLLISISGCFEELPPPDIKYVRNHLDEFRGPDVNGNTLDDEKIEPNILSLHSDPYVQKALIAIGVHWQAILENADNLEKIRFHFEQKFRPVFCLGLLLVNQNLDTGLLQMKVRDFVQFSKERRALADLASRTFDGHSYVVPKDIEKGEGIKDRRDYAWNDCPFEFAPGDKDKYYSPWKKELERRDEERRKNWEKNPPTSKEKMEAHKRKHDAYFEKLRQKMKHQ